MVFRKRYELGQQIEAANEANAQLLAENEQLRQELDTLTELASPYLPYLEDARDQKKRLSREPSNGQEFADRVALVMDEVGKVIGAEVRQQAALVEYRRNKHEWKTALENQIECDEKEPTEEAARVLFAEQQEPRIRTETKAALRRDAEKKAKREGRERINAELAKNIPQYEVEAQHTWERDHEAAYRKEREALEKAHIETITFAKLEALADKETAARFATARAEVEAEVLSMADQLTRITDEVERTHKVQLSSFMDGSVLKIHLNGDEQLLVRLEDAQVGKVFVLNHAYNGRRDADQPSIDNKEFVLGTLLQSSDDRQTFKPGELSFGTLVGVQVSSDAVYSAELLRLELVNGSDALLIGQLSVDGSHVTSPHSRNALLRKEQGVLPPEPMLQKADAVERAPAPLRQPIITDYGVVHFDFEHMVKQGSFYANKLVFSEDGGFELAHKEIHPHLAFDILATERYDLSPLLNNSWHGDDHFEQILVEVIETLHTMGAGSELSKHLKNTIKWIENDRTLIEFNMGHALKKNSFYNGDGQIPSFTADQLLDDYVGSFTDSFSPTEWRSGTLR